MEKKVKLVGTFIIALIAGVSIGYFAQPSISPTKGLKTFFSDPVPPDLPDHIVKDLGKTVVFLHFNKPVDQPGAELIYIGVGVKGKFLKKDQPTELGFTHFHGMRGGHGGPPGTEGVWVVHIAVKELEMPWGKIKPGVDLKFMPTLAPE